MPNMSIDIAGGFYASDSLPFSNQRCVNLYPHVPQGNAITQSALFNTEGLQMVARTGSTKPHANRGSIEFQGKPYFVNGTRLYRLDRSVSVTGSVTYSSVNLGFVGGNGRVSMAENGTQILIINGEGLGFIYSPAATPDLQEISDAGFTANGTPEKVVYVDRYFVVSTSDKKAIISAVGDGTNWNSLDVITAEADPDDVVSPYIHKNQLYLLGTQTVEQYQNIGGAGVPFQRINGWIVGVGCTAPDSVVKMAESVYWVGKAVSEQSAIWMFSGGEPVKVSSIAIDNKLNNLTEAELQQTYAFAYGVAGNRFIHFTTPRNTFVYNEVTQRWHERESTIEIDETGQRVDPCRITSVVEAYNELFVGDTQDGRIGIVDEDSVTEYDSDLISYFTTQPLSNNSNAFSMPVIELNCETGVGTETVRDPKVRMEISRDGVVFENPRVRELGNSGDRSIRPRWCKNGRVSRRMVLRFTISDAVRRRLYSIDCKFKQLASA